MYLYKVRPKPASKQPKKTREEYCIYHSLHKDYSYSQQWIDFLIKQVRDEAEFSKIKSLKIPKKIRNKDSTVLP